MVIFLLGLLTGFTLTIWYVVLDFNLGFDTNISVNVVIASSTIIATAIHYDSIKKQRRDRVWEINKDNLLNLSRSLSKVIETTTKYADQEFNQMNGIPDDQARKPDPAAYHKFTQSLSESLNVYKPLLNKELISAIEDFQKSEKLIDEKVNDNAICTFEAYEELNAIQHDLHGKVCNFIKKVSGI